MGGKGLRLSIATQVARGPAPTTITSQAVSPNRRASSIERRYSGSRNLQALVAMPRRELADEWVGAESPQVKR
jgi:hypothetical protein